MPEIADALLVRGGPPVVNGATALWSAVACAALLLAFRRQGMAMGVASGAALALAATPIVYVNSANAMDYIWALSFLLLSWWAAVAGRPAWAGIALGIAIGCRLSSAVGVLPLLFLIRSPDRHSSAARARFLVAAALATGIVLSPVLLASGPGFLRVYETGHTPWLYVLKGASVDVWGVLGTLALLLAIPVGLARLARGRASLPQAEAAAIAVALALFGLVYLRLPHEGAYLIPIVPFVLLFLARSLPRAGFLALCATLWISAFVLKIAEPGKLDSPASSPAARTVSALGRKLTVDPRGPVLWDHERRLAGLAFRDRVLARANALPAGSVVAAREWAPALRWTQAPGEASRVSYVHLLDKQQAAALMTSGRPIYYLPEAAWANRAFFGVDLDSLGARPLFPELP